MEKKFKEDCGFRKHLKLCGFTVDHCRPEQEGDEYGDYCNLYELEWDAKWLKKKAKEVSKTMLMLEKELKHLKQTDKVKYGETKKRIRDMFDGCVMMGKAIMFIKRSGRGLNKADKRVADKLMQKLKAKEKS